MRRRYLSLGLGELVAAAVFAGVAVTKVAPALDTTGRRALWGALVPLLVVLVQAGVYWLLARGWVLRSGMPSALASVFRTLKVVDVVLLVAGLVVVLVWWPSRPLVAVLVLAVWVFGLVEYLNYFVARLAYPPTGWLREVRRWRTPRLVKDMRTQMTA